MTPKQREENEPHCPNCKDIMIFFGVATTALGFDPSCEPGKIDPMCTAEAIRFHKYRLVELENEVDRLLSALIKAQVALDGLLDGLSANYDPERCGLDSKTWDKRVEIAEKASEEIDKVLGSKPS